MPHMERCTPNNYVTSLNQRVWLGSKRRASQYQIDDHASSSLKAIFQCGRFVCAGGATNFNYVKNQSHGHRRTSRKLNVVLHSWRVREHSNRQKMHRIDNYRESWVMFALPARAKGLQWNIALMYLGIICAVQQISISLLYFVFCFCNKSQCFQMCETGNHMGVRAKSCLGGGGSISCPTALLTKYTYIQLCSRFYQGLF
jgi:hypothetical protein